MYNIVYDIKSKVYVSIPEDDYKHTIENCKCDMYVLTTPAVIRPDETLYIPNPYGEDNDSVNKLKNYQDDARFEDNVWINILVHTPKIDELKLLGDK